MADIHFAHSSNTRLVAIRRQRGLVDSLGWLWFDRAPRPSGCIALASSHCAFGQRIQVIPITLSRVHLHVSLHRPMIHIVVGRLVVRSLLLRCGGGTTTRREIRSSIRQLSDAAECTRIDSQPIAASQQRTSHKTNNQPTVTRTHTHTQVSTRTRHDNQPLACMSMPCVVSTSIVCRRSSCTRAPQLTSAQPSSTIGTTRCCRSTTPHVHAPLILPRVCSSSLFSTESEATHIRSGA
jgi:hypothetical protein